MTEGLNNNNTYLKASGITQARDPIGIEGLELSGDICTR